MKKTQDPITQEEVDLIKEKEEAEIGEEKGEIEEEIFKPYFITSALNLTMIIKQPKIQYNQEGQRIILDQGITARFHNKAFIPRTQEEHDLMFEHSRKKDYIKYVSAKDLQREHEKANAIAKAIRDVDDKYK